MKTIIITLVVSFIVYYTINAQTVKDIDGNVYKTIKIGSQEWMAENLKSTHYADGTALIGGSNAGVTYNDSVTRYYFVYENNSANKEQFGLLYPWYSIVGKNICPNGWHVPSLDEWQELTNYFKDNKIDGKSISSSSGWEKSGDKNSIACNQSSNNKTGFNCFPGGTRQSSGVYSSKGYFGYWWSSTSSSSSSAYYVTINLNSSELLQNYEFKAAAFSVRCLKD